METTSFSTLTFGLTSHLNASRHSFDSALVLNVANGFFLPVLRARGIPTALNTDGLEWERGKWGPTAQRVFKAGARLSATFADVLITDSEEIGRIWKNRFGVSSTFIPYGAQVIDFGSPVDKLVPLGLKPDGYVLIVARLVSENNVELLLDAVERVTPRPRLVVVGSAAHRSPLEARLRAADDRDQLLWLGHVSDQTLLTQLWSHAAVYLHGHSVGGTNPGLLQAMGAGAPTLALDTPFNREVLRDDSNLFAPDRDDLAQRIRMVLASPDSRREMSSRQREIIASRYRWADVSARYLEALKEARRVHNA